MSRACRTLARPPRMVLLPFHWPDWLATGRGRPACGLFVIEAAEFGHGGDELVGGQRSHTGDAGQDLMSAGKFGIGSDQAGDLDIEGRHGD